MLSVVNNMIDHQEIPQAPWKSWKSGYTMVNPQDIPQNIPQVRGEWDKDEEMEFLDLDSLN